MQDWIKENFWPLLIAILTIGSTYTLYGYRISTLEKRADDADTKIAALQDSNNTIFIDIEGIQKDVEYIRLQVDKIVK